MLIISIIILMVKYWYISVPVLGIIAFLWAKAQD